MRFIDSLRNVGNRLALISPLRWLFIAAVFHILVCIAVFLSGRFQLLPNTFDEYGIGIGFAIDGKVYLKITSNLADILGNRSFTEWLQFKTPLHLKLYSLAFIFPGAITGQNILAVEPLNLLYYLSVLTFVYLISKELFGSSTGLLAAGLVGVWPTFLLHTTQLIRDSLSICLMLGLIWILLISIQRYLDWKRTGLAALHSLALIVVIWVIRGNFWNVILAAIAITLILVLIRMVTSKELLIPNLALVIFILLSALILPPRIDSSTTRGTRAPTAVIAVNARSESSNSMWTRLVTQIRARRGGFSVYDAKASNIDDEIQFNDATDIVRFLPRATVIGFFAPFPRMWFESGSTGRTGRLIAGAETFLMYLLYIPALFCLWRERKKLGVWLLSLTSAIGVIALGLVVVNAGALFRLRYVFWILIVTLAVEGVVVFCKRGQAPRTSQ